MSLLILVEMPLWLIVISLSDLRLRCFKDVKQWRFLKGIFMIFNNISERNALFFLFILKQMHTHTPGRSPVQPI